LIDDDDDDDDGDDEQPFFNVVPLAPITLFPAPLEPITLFPNVTETRGLSMPEFQYLAVMFIIVFGQVGYMVAEPKKLKCK